MKNIKTITITTIILLMMGFTMNAQNLSSSALGLRLGDNNSFGAEISFQNRLSSNSRLEFDLGFRSSNNVDAYKLIGIYQRVMPLGNSFNWYLGIGGGIGSFNTGLSNGSGQFLLAVADIGIEFNFNIPIQLSLDFRPEWSFNDSYRDDLGLDIALGIRYRF